MMKAIFIDNYRAHSIIESRIESFANWETHGRPGDGVISPVSVIKSPDDRSVLLTYDRNQESTNVKNSMESQYDDEMAGLWFGDMLNKENLEVFKEMGGGTILYVDQAKSNANVMDTFLNKMHSIGKLNHATLDAIKPMLTPAQYASYESIIPSYDDISRIKAEIEKHSELAPAAYTIDEFGNEITQDKPSMEDVQPDPAYNDDSFNSGLNNADNAIDPTIVDFNPEIVSVDESEVEPQPVEIQNSEPEISTTDDEYNLQPEGLRDGYDSDNAELPEEIPEINPSFEKGSNDEMNEYNDTDSLDNTETEVTTVKDTTTINAKYNNILDGINMYLEKYDMTIDQFMETVFKLRFVLNQISDGNVPTENTSADLPTDPETIDESIPSEPPISDTPEPAQNVSTPVQNLLNSVAEEMNTSEVNEADDTVSTVDNSSIENADNEVSETISTESVGINAEKELINQMMKISNNDNEFFNNIVQYKERLSTETVNDLVSIKLYDKILTGMTVHNMINVRDERARKLGIL